jgi:hypothetical protein
MEKARSRQAAHRHSLRKTDIVNVAVTVALRHDSVARRGTAMRRRTVLVGLSLGAFAANLSWLAGNALAPVQAEYELTVDNRCIGLERSQTPESIEASKIEQCTAEFMVASVWKCRAPQFEIAFGNHADHMRVPFSREIGRVSDCLSKVPGIRVAARQISKFDY